MLNNFFPFPVLQTERLILRQLSMQDEKEIFLLRSDESVNKHIDRPLATSLKDAQEFIKKINDYVAANESLYWAINFKNDKKLIGTVCY
jgi:ribosomal-protein-alanine N-acetyltransferase